MRSIFAYHASYLIDHKLGVIVDAEGTRANRSDENRAAVAMVGRVGQRFALKPKRLAADTVYGNARTLKTLVEQGIDRTPSRANMTLTKAQLRGLRAL